MRKMLTAAAVLLSALMLTGCENMKQEKKPEIPQFSDEYLVGTYYGGAGWGEFYECLSARLIVCTNHELLVYLPLTEPYKVLDYQLAETLTLTDAQYQAIARGLDREKLYTLDPQEDREVCDGGTTELLLYDKEQNVAKACGGYMPQNEDFWEMYHAVIDNLPTDTLDKLRTDWIGEQRQNARNN